MAANGHTSDTDLDMLDLEQRVHAANPGGINPANVAAESLARNSPTLAQPGDVGPLNFRHVLDTELGRSARDGKQPPHVGFADAGATGDGAAHPPLARKTAPVKSAMAQSPSMPSSHAGQEGNGAVSKMPRLSMPVSRPAARLARFSVGPGIGVPRGKTSLGKVSLGAAIKGNAGTANPVRLIDAARGLREGEALAGVLEERLREADEAVMLTQSPTMFMSGPLEGSDPYAKPQAWYKQITLRSLIVGGILGFAISVVMMNLNLTTGIIPSLNIAAGILGYFLIKSWVTLMTWLKFDPFPFTPQENTVIQTCVVSCYGLAFAGGFGSYLLAMDINAYKAVGAHIPGNNAEDVSSLSLSRTIPYMAMIGFTGVFLLVQLRKTFIIDYALPYPSGTATGILISSFHTPKGAVEAQEQVKRLGVWGMVSFLWAAFKWFFGAESALVDGTELACNTFDGFPSLGLKALAHNWNFDFALDYIGAGLICPHEVNFSLLFGAIISWGILWPLIQAKAGTWYGAELEDHDFRGFTGYKNFIAIAIFMGDGMYNMIKVFVLSGISYWATRKVKRAGREEEEIHKVVQSPRGSLRTMSLRMDPYEDPAETKAAQVKALRTAVFLKDQVSPYVAYGGMVASMALSIPLIPRLYPQVKWYYILLSYIFVPFFSLANAYAQGLTDWNMATIYGKIALFCFAAWAGAEGGGVIAGLAMCGVVLAVTNAAGDLMQDFRTGFITLSSPRAMFGAQLIGALFGVFIGPLSFYLFNAAFPVGVPGSQYPAPYAAIFRSMAIIGVEGFAGLPAHCPTLMIAFFVASIALCLLKDLLPPKYAIFVPIPAAAAIAFYVGGSIAIDMVIGSVIKWVWEMRRPQDAELSVPCAASGLICGAGLWAVPAALMAIFGVKAPICMFFAPGAR